MPVCEAKLRVAMRLQASPGRLAVRLVQVVLCSLHLSWQVLEYS